MRLDKFIANVTDWSRAEAKKILKEGRVTVAGKTVTDARLDVPEDAEVAIDQQLLRSAQPRYFMLHKPEGYISATKDRQHLTVMDLFDEDNLDKLHIAGRLDIDTTGLVLVTDDGSWSHRITSPHSGCKKTYWLETADPISNSMIENLSIGIKLDGEKRPTKPAAIELLDEHTARMTITEGKYHQVKRMWAAVGNHVDKLHRESIGGIVLDEDLQAGEYRKLTVEEINRL